MLIIAEQSQPFLLPCLTLCQSIWLVQIARPELRVFGVWCSGGLGVGGCMSPDLRSPSNWGLGWLQSRYRYRCGGSVLHLVPPPPPPPSSSPLDGNINCCSPLDPFERPKDNASSAITFLFKRLWTASSF